MLFQFRIDTIKLITALDALAMRFVNTCLAGRGWHDRLRQTAALRVTAANGFFAGLTLKSLSFEDRRF